VLVVIFVIAGVLLRTALGGAYVVAPLVMALAVNLGLFAWLHIRCFRSARRVERQSRHESALRPLGALAAGVQVSLVTFFVAAMFHPIAYQFYFFTIAGLAVALKNTARATA